MTKHIFMLSLLCSTLLMAVSDRTENSSRSDQYRLYDRNQAGLDFNRFSYPDSRDSTQDEFSEY